MTLHAPSDEELNRLSRADSLETEERQHFEINRAKSAKELLNNPMIVEAFSNLEDVYGHALRFSPIDAPEVRELARYRLEALDHFKNELQHIVTTGSIAETERSDTDALGEWLSEENLKSG